MQFQPRWATRLAMLAGGFLAAIASAQATRPAIVSNVAHPIVIPAPDAAAGGWTDGGPEGAYFTNPKLAGKPACSRHDVRIDFDWSKFLPIGGSPAEAYRSFPRDGFSVRWTGSVVPRFSEKFIFRYRASGAVSLLLKPPVPNNCKRFSTS